MDEDVEVALRRVADACFAFAGNADACAFVNAGRDFHRQVAAAERSAFADADVARIGNDLAASTAARTATLDHEEALLRADSSGTAARAASLCTVRVIGAAAA